MAVTNPWTITWNGTAYGGSSTSYLLHGPYVIDKTHARLRLVFDVVVVGTGEADMQTQAAALETNFRARDANLVIDINGSSWTYTATGGAPNFLNSTSSCTKSGNPDVDQTASRMYTCVIEGELPSDDQSGLRDLELLVDYDASRQKTVTFRGVYTPDGSNLAVAQYEADFPAEATTLLTAIDSAATWEQVDETYQRDRLDHVCSFTRQYVELLEDQSSGTRDYADIRDHRVVFTDLSQHPGDSRANVYRLRRVAATYDCAIDIDGTITDPQSIYDSVVKDHVKSLFQTNFTPQVFAVESHTVSYDHTQSRLSAQVQFVYQKSGGDAIVEVASSLTMRDTRTIDYTYTHDGGPLSAFVDEGFALKERIGQRTAIVMGSRSPTERLNPTGAGSRESAAGEIPVEVNGAQVKGIEPGSVEPALGRGSAGGWVTISYSSQITPQWLGDPDHGQVQVTVLNESVTQRYTQQPARSRR